jgi:O-Antigen ligase
MSPLSSLLFSITVGLLALPRLANAIVVQPSELQFDTRLDEAPLLTLDIDLETVTPKDFTVEIGGIQCDRRVLSKGTGRYTVEIAPDTSVTGAAHGSIVFKNSGMILGTPIPISGIVRPWVSVQPAKLFIGSIGHGANFTKPQTYSTTLASDNDLFDVESVEFQGIQGATWTCEPKTGNSAPRKELKFTFSPDAFADGVPYGALAKKAILVHLSHSKASTIVIPVLGLVSINTTGRDYSQYLYHGQVRWSGRWGTPNVAAAFIATATILLCGIACALHQRLSGRPRWQIALAVIVFPAMAAGCYFLAGTYSRGGWFAAVIGIAVLLFGMRSPRLYTIGLAVLFAIAIATHPAGLNRAASTTLVSQDKSAHHRLLVWQGALQMMAEHPWRGVGPGQFGKTFAKDYQLPTHTQEYTTAINDFLTLGAERGIPMLALVSSIASGLILFALKIGIKERNSFLTGCAAAILCYLVCCWFSSIAFHRNTSYLALASAAGIIIGVGFREVRHAKESLPRRISRYSILWASLAIAIATASSTAGVVALFKRPVVCKFSVDGLRGLEVRPRWGASRGAILYFGDRPSDGEFLLKSTLRPLAQKGWTVFTLDQSRYSSDACAATSSLIQKMQTAGILTGPWFIAGHRQGAQTALAAASVAHPRAVTCYLTPARSAFLDLSPCIALPKLSAPIQLVAQDADTARSSQHLSELIRASQGAGRSLEPVIHHGEFSIESSFWQQWITDIDTFCGQNL